MNHDDRISYAQMLIDFEWEIGGITHVTEEAWKRRFLNREDVDPLNVHKPYGLTVPQLVHDKWHMAVCVPPLLRPVQQCSDQDLGYWLEYWIAHMTHHFLVLGQAADMGESNLPLDEIERRVTAEMERNEPFLHELAEKIKSLQQME